METQLWLSIDGRIRGNVERSIDILRMFEPPEGYFLAFSGGKDSQCVYHLALMAGVKFDAHYSVTSVDPPELVRFIREHYPEVAFDIPKDSDGKPVTMWSLIASHTLPPTRKVRYCCSALKECNGTCRVTLTGVRRAESNNRKRNQGMVTITGKSKKVYRKAVESGADFTKTDRGGLVLNYDNDSAKQLVEHCYRTTKTLVNPIIDWTEQDVWDFLNSNHIPHCSLYDEGFKRLGCIGCPMSGSKNMMRDFERWPKYKELYIRAFQKMIDNHPGQIKVLNPGANTKYKLDVPESVGGGTLVQVVDQVLPLTGCTGSSTAQSIENNAGGGTGQGDVQAVAQNCALLSISSKTTSAMAASGHRISDQAIRLYEHFVEMGAI